MKRFETKRRQDAAKGVALLVRRTRQKAADERGVAAIELALILPFLLILMLGAMEIFLMSMAARKTARVTNTVGDLVAQAPGTLTKRAIDGYFEAAKVIMGNFPRNKLGLTIYVFGKDKRGRPTLRWSHQLGIACRGKPPRLGAAQRSAMRDGNDLVITFGCYRYATRVGKLVLGSRTFTLRSQVALRPRKQMKLACKDC